MPFIHYIGIDYPGAQTPTASLKGLRIYVAEGEEPPAEAPPPLVAHDGIMAGAAPDEKAGGADGGRLRRID